MCLSVPGLLTVYHSSTPSTPGTVVTIASPLLPAGHSTSDKNSQDMPDSHYPQVKCAFFIASLPRCLHLSTVNCQLVTGNCDRFSYFYVLPLYPAPPSLSVSVSVNFFSYFLSLLLLLPLPSPPPSPFPRFPSLSLDHRPLSCPRRFTGVPPGTNFTLKFAEVLSHPPLKVVTRGVEGPGAVKFDGSVYMGNLFWADPVRIEQRQQTETAVRESR